MLNRVIKKVPALKKPLYKAIKSLKHYDTRNYIQLSGPLFEEVQTTPVFPDSMTFVDCTPLYSRDHINLAYRYEQLKPNFDLKRFVKQNFMLPRTKKFNHQKWEELTQLPLKEYLTALWPILYRQPSDDQNPRSTLIHLPHPYIVPGGRFNCIYYWDTYFTALGLISSGHHKIVAEICDNFVYLIKQLGHIPNGNRVYLASRSQPPFFALLIDLLAQHTRINFLKYIPDLEKEYAYWMLGSQNLSRYQTAHYKIVKLRDGELANRYYDYSATPRHEAYKEDLHLTAHLPHHDKIELYQHLRAGAESGWDYSSRWFADYHSIKTSRTLDIIPVDLNCLLYVTEQKLSEWMFMIGEPKKGAYYLQQAEHRAAMIQKYCYSKHHGFYFDYLWREDKRTECFSLAGVYPLFAKIATQTQADRVATLLETQFLKRGGLVTTLHETGEQWDYQNGWAPLQWIAIQGLRNYGHVKLASEIKKRWLAANDFVFTRTGLMFEKYNVIHPRKLATGGEYPVQSGFGWTNGVAFALLSEK